MMTDWEYREDSGYDETFSAPGDAEAEKLAEQLLREGDWNQASAEKSFRVRASLGRVEHEPDGLRDVVDLRTVMVQFDPPEPKCTGTEHDWQSPLELVGGIAENPGVYGNGGGVIITEACVTCGAQKITNTWDTDPANGEQFRSLAYQPAGHYDIPADGDGEVWTLARSTA